MSKKILILDIKNSSTSIIAEAVLNRYLGGIDTYSSGIRPDSKVDQNTIKLLQREGIWNEKYHPKNFNTLSDIEFDLVIIVCESAMNNSLNFSENTQVIHVEYETLDKKSFSEYEQIFKEIKMELIPISRLELNP